ncbi:MAG: TetR/AcrR family transcriptional regulator [Planctomycetes bacterium]|nr:TetR/AcrR family transcriptional regulator [Planctomycetota bacterium]
MARPKLFNPNDALELAVRGFWRWGYHAASVDMLVKFMGVSRQSLYDTFGDKQRLFRGGISHYEATVLNRELLLLDAENAVDGLKKVAAIWTSLLKSTTDEPAGCLITNALCELFETEPSLHAECREIEARFVRKLRHTFERASEEGMIPFRSDPAQMAGQWMILRHGLMVARRAGADDAFFRSAGYELQSMLIG